MLLHKTLYPKPIKIIKIISDNAITWILHRIGLQKIYKKYKNLQKIQNFFIKILKLQEMVNFIRKKLAAEECIFGELKITIQNYVRLFRN